MAELKWKVGDRVSHLYEKDRGIGIVTSINCDKYPNQPILVKWEKFHKEIPYTEEGTQRGEKIYIRKLTKLGQIIA